MEMIKEMRDILSSFSFCKYGLRADSYILFGLEKEFTVPLSSETKWIIRFFVTEFSTLSKETCYDMLVDRIWYYISNRWWYGELKPTKAELDYFKKRKNNKNHWLWHYRNYELWNGRLKKPKTTAKSRRNIKKLYIKSVEKGEI